MLCSEQHNLAALVEQQSDHINLLKDKVERLEDLKCTQQCNGVKDDEGNNSGLSKEHAIIATMKYCTPNAIKNNSANGEREEKEQVVDEEKENGWSQPNNCISMKHVCETCGKKEDRGNSNNNEHVEFSDNEEKEEDE